MRNKVRYLCTFLASLLMGLHLENGHLLGQLLERNGLHIDHHNNEIFAHSRGLFYQQSCLKVFQQESPLQLAFVTFCQSLKLLSLEAQDPFRRFASKPGLNQGARLVGKLNVDVEVAGISGNIAAQQKLHLTGVPGAILQVSWYESLAGGAKMERSCFIVFLALKM